MSNWSMFTEELDRWQDAGLIANFWWRDDDAVSNTEALDLLLRCADGVPLALAVVSGLADQSLVDRLSDEAAVSVLHHGWQHYDHAKVLPSSEYPSGRDPDHVLAELKQGSSRLISLFDAQAIPVFVPPWHGFDKSYLPLLAQAGIKGISAKGPRAGPKAAGLTQVNIHCVPIEWTVPPMFGDEVKYLRQICSHLEGRRTGKFDPLEPTGLLTHHLVQDGASYDFMSRVSEVVRGHASSSWLGIREVFALGPQRDISQSG